MAADAATLALREMRVTRRHHRLGKLEWFEALYRVYLAAIVGGGAVLFLSGLITDDQVSPDGVSDVLRLGPPVLGLIAAFAFALGLRSGANGGPLAMEEADVRYVLLAPISHQTALRHPGVQRLRALAFGGAVGGAIGGELAARRLPGGLAEWAWWGAVYGIVVALLYGGAALVAHGLRLSRGLTFVAGAAIVAWQAAAVATDGDVWAPGDPVGGIALWPLRDDWPGLAAAAITALLVALGLSLVHRMSLEALARRSGLIAQLKFAVTLQDIRTVMLLRRQLGQEQTRRTPWVRLRRAGRTPAVWRRDWQGIARFPARKLGRMVLLAAAAGACAAAVDRGVTAAVLGCGIALFVLGLEACEPLSQEVDQPDRQASLPVPRHRLFLGHLAAPALLLVPFALVAGVVAALVAPSHSGGALAAVGILCIPMTLGGAAGGVVNIVKGAPSQETGAMEAVALPPEVSGITTVFRSVWPVAVSVFASLGVIAVREGVALDQNVVSLAARAALGDVLVIAAVVAWVRYRDDARQWWHANMDAAKSSPGTTRSAS